MCSSNNNNNNAIDAAKMDISAFAHIDFEAVVSNGEMRKLSLREIQWLTSHNAGD